MELDIHKFYKLNLYLHAISYQYIDKKVSRKMDSIHVIDCGYVFVL